ncbi:hypothetical protein JCGZ_09708 [Jatropha curcas]|uniref:Uncharacterized protein n=1 Tax=Jatropha curcas TaxID=180498 RepID=A0A067LM26_JATCU|nr:hypothetical protein JCGZ_09708 [Jatropha curcas]
MEMARFCRRTPSHGGAAFQSRYLSILALIARTNTTEKFVSTKGSRWSARLPDPVADGRKMQ